jgi:hypothetical protein
MSMMLPGSGTGETFTGGADDGAGVGEASCSAVTAGLLAAVVSVTWATDDPAMNASAATTAVNRPKGMGLRPHESLDGLSVASRRSDVKHELGKI